MRVIIQGAGIAGLTLARELARAGVEFRIVEHADALRPVGAGIVLGANAQERLGRTLDLPRLIRKGSPLEGMNVTDHRGRPILRSPGKVRGIPLAPLAIHRHALHEELLEGLPRENLLLGTRVESFEQDADGVRVKYSDGRIDRCEYLVGADGIRSAIRDALFPSAAARFSGYTCWRAVLPYTLKDPSSAIEMWGPGRRVGLVPIGQGQLYFFSTLNIPPERYSRGDTDLPVDQALEQYREFGGEVPDVLERLRSAGSLIHNDLEEIELPRWHQGRVVLIGDAAHAMTPNLGQGAGMAIEDAAALAELWRSDPSPASLAEFERARRPRVSWIQRKSREMGALAQKEGASFTWIRNGLLRLVPGILLERNLRQVVQPRS